MKLSVIIPTHNRYRTLRNTLAALSEQSLPACDFEVLVVDDGSEDAVRREIRSLATEFDCTLVEKEQGGLASARNAGADRAGGKLLHFLDDDVIPSPDSLKEHVAAHDSETEPIAVVGALPYPPHVKIDSFLWYVEESGHYDLYRHAARKYEGGVPPMPPLNGNSSISRELFFHAGKYDESFRQYGSEDLELGYRLSRAGVRFVYNPRAVGYHDHVKDFARFCSDMETAGRSLIRLYKKYPEIKAPKKIDLVEDRLADLAWGKRPAKIIMETTLRFPWILALPRLVLRLVGPFFALRRLAFPFYRWVAYYHYALGMRKALANVE